jgi:hypothetical protein
VFSRSQQAQDNLPIAGARKLHLVGLVFGVVACLGTIAGLGKSLPRSQLALFVVVFAGVVWSAIVTGALSGPYDRYLARVIWLVCFAGLLGGSMLWMRMTSRDQSANAMACRSKTKEATCSNALA